MRIARTVAAVSFVVIAGSVGTAGAGTVSGFDGSVFARARVGSGDIQSGQLTPSGIGHWEFSQEQVERNGAVQASSDYQFKQVSEAASFRIDIAHSVERPMTHWLAQADGIINFHLDRAAVYTINGLYQSSTAAKLTQYAALVNVTDPRNSVEVFSSNQQSAGGVLRLESDPFGSGTTTGVLSAGSYMLIYADSISSSSIRGMFKDPGKSNPTSGSGDIFAAGSGYFELNMAPSVVPLPATVWSGMALLVCLSVRPLVKILRRQSADIP